jgi:Spy/CpxP family protein refolding chaperone
MNRKRLLGICVLTLVFCALVTIPSWGQRAGQAKNPGPLGFWKQALNRAGATALDSTQESALTSLISAFRAANRPAAPNSAELAARDAYADAILSGDANATAAADNLAGVLAARQQTRLEAEAQFAIQALAILHSDQIAALQNSVGKQGLLRVLSSLGGLGGRPGAGMMMGRSGQIAARARRNQQ